MLIAICWLLACRPAPLPPLTPDFEVVVRPSRWVPSAHLASWEGPAGAATVWVADPDHLGDDDLTLAPDTAGSAWRRWTTAQVEAGPASLSLALLPVGRTYRFRVGVARAGVPTLWSELGTLNLPEAPDLLGAPHVVDVEELSEVAAGGWIVTQRYGTPGQPDTAYAVILDPSGEVVWWTEPLATGQRVIRVRASRDLHSVLVLQDHREGADFVQRTSLDGETRLDTPTPDASHDFYENDDGTLTWIGYERSESGLIPGVPFPVAADVLRTVAEGETDPAQIEDGFSFLQDFPAAPTLGCPHTLPDGFVPGAVDWSHGNSLLRAPADDGWLVLARNLDALLHVADDGSRTWQVGGVDATLTPSSPEDVFHHGHTSHAWTEDGGLHVLVFDNGDHTPAPIVSRVLELRIDPDAGTYERVWALPDPSRRFTSFLGDARRLPGGNTLVTWTPYQEMVEYTSEGEEVWRLEADARFGRSAWVPTLLP